MSFFMVDVETDGPYPDPDRGYSMIQIGAVVVREGLTDTFFGKLRPISPHFQPEALTVSGVTREETLHYERPSVVMQDFENWIKRMNIGKRAMFISDNNGFDFMFTCWYMNHFLGSCIFGHSSTNLGSLYKGLVRDTRRNFKHLRRTRHTHNPVDDAMGNAEALFRMKDRGLSIILE